MSEEKVVHKEHISSNNFGQFVTTRNEDGEIKILEMTPFQNEPSSGILSELQANNDNGQPKYITLDPTKEVLNLQWCNLQVVKNEYDNETIALIAKDSSNSESGESTSTLAENNTFYVQSSEGDLEEIKFSEGDGSGTSASTTTSAYILQQSDGEAEDDGDSQANQETYVIVEGQNGPMVFLQSSLQQINKSQVFARPAKKTKDIKALTPKEVLEKVKILQKLKVQLDYTSSKKGRKRKSDLAQELIDSPNFKLYIYSCKSCDFKCNAIKELSAHRNSVHSTPRYRSRNYSTLQCAKCPYRGTLHSQLVKHFQEAHKTHHASDKESQDPMTEGISIDSEEADDADVLVCGACGFETVTKQAMKEHLVHKHDA